MIFLHENTCNEANDALKSINDEISELHECAVKEIEPQPKVKVTEGVNITLEDHNPGF